MPLLYFARRSTHALHPEHATPRHARALSAASLAVACLLAPAALGEPRHFGIATGTPVGTYYPLGGALAQLVSNKAVLGDRRIVATGELAAGSIANARALGRGEIDSAIVAADVLDAAWRGLDAFDQAPQPGLRAIGALFPEVVQVLARADAPVRALPDLRRTGVSSGPPGAPRYQVLTDLLLAHGMKRSDVADDYSALPDSIAALRDGTLAATVLTAGVPTTAVAQLARSVRVRLLPVAAPEADELVARRPYYVRTVVPAGTYPGQDQDVPTLAIMAVWATHAAVPEEVVYAVCKAVYENAEVLAQVHPQGRHVRLRSALASVTVPLHPGAQRYFLEKGVLRP